MKYLALQRSRAMSRTSWRWHLSSILALACGGWLIAPAPADAQHSHSGTNPPSGAADHETIPSPTVSARAREQIAAVERAMASLKTPDSGAAADFLPFLGMLPTMGVHQVNQVRILD